jgi:hypothetical protein
MMSEFASWRGLLASTLFVLALLSHPQQAAAVTGQESERGTAHRIVDSQYQYAQVSQNGGAYDNGVGIRLPM